jgi:WD40 repeat protein
VTAGALLLFAGLAVAAPPVTALAFAPAGRSVVVGSQAGLEIRSWPGLEPIRALPTDLANVHDLAFSPDGKTLAAVGGTPGKCGAVELFGWPGGARLRSAAPHRDSVYKVAWRSDSACVLTAGGDATVRLVRADTGETLRTLEGHSRGVLAVVFLPGDASVVSAGLDESVRTWAAATGEPVRTFANHTRPVTDLAVRPGGGAAAPPVVASAGEDRTVRLWQPTVGRMVRFARLDAVPLAVAWARDGGRVFAACKDGRVRVLDPDTMAVTDTWPGVDGVAYCVAVAPDGTVLVGGQGGQVRRLAVTPSRP